MVISEMRDLNLHIRFEHLTIERRVRESRSMRRSRAHTRTLRQSFLVLLGADTQNYDGCTNGGAHIKEGEHGKAAQGEAASLHRLVYYLCGGGVCLD